MNHRVLRLSLWAILCAGVLWGMLDYRSAAPRILSYSAPHVAALIIAILAMICGTVSLQGAATRRWDFAFLILAIFPAAQFAGKNFFLRGEFGVGELAVT